MGRGFAIAALGLAGVVLAACGLGVVGAAPGGDGGGDADPGPSDGALADGDAADSGTAACAADLASDPANCGACGHDCLGGACAAGACQPTVFVSGEDGVTGVAIVGSALYWTRETAGLVRTAPLAGGAPTTLLSVGAGGPKNPCGIGTDGTSLFVTDRFDAKISKWSVAGVEAWTRSSFDSATGIAVYGATVFVTSQALDQIVAADSDGANPAPRMSSLNYPAGVAVANGLLFASSGSGILMAPVDTGTPVGTVSPTSRFQDGGGDLIHTGIAADGATLWFTIGSRGVVATIPAASGGSARVIAPQQTDPVGITVSPTAIYWAARGANAIMKLAR